MAYAAIPSSCGPTVYGRDVGLSNRGIGAMWIVMYVAMIASLSAMGFSPSLLPVETDKDRLPHDDV